MSSFYEPAEHVTYEEKIKRSVFIANLQPCHDETEARDFLMRITAQHRNAAHNCRAYVIMETEYSSDDGEPSGTAGKPILNAIKHSGLLNVMIVVTRYFGGIKLGVRGLIEAYGGVAAKALELAGRVERVMMRAFSVSMGYASMGTVTHLLESCGASCLKWDYGECVNVRGDIPEEFCGYLSQELEGLRARGIITEWEQI